ncbi:MAG: type II secretion system F family protein [Candidatus Pacearchaeota archaeon]|jgi:flagellar protein FlaJ
MRLKRGTISGIVAGIIIILSSFLFYFEIIPGLEPNKNIFYFLLGVGVLIMLLPFVLYSIFETKIEREKDEMFLEFSRSLLESVDSGTPISKSIINMKAKNFGSLSPHIEKLANQIELGIPVKDALETFAYDTKSKTIIRAITLIREAEKTGGNINAILESVATSVSELEKLKSERRAAISSIVVEGYIIFFIFIIIMIVMQVQIIPMTTNLAGLPQTGTTGIPGGENIGLGGGTKIDPQEFSNAFLALLVAQGLFAGLIIGKLSEGSLKAGIKHSFIMVAMAILMSTGASIILK